MRKILLLTLVGMAICSLSVFAQQEEKFYVYSDKNSPSNHFIPSFTCQHRVLDEGNLTR